MARGKTSVPRLRRHDDQLAYLAELLRIQDVELQLAIDELELVARGRLGADDLRAGGGERDHGLLVGVECREQRLVDVARGLERPAESEQTALCDDHARRR